MSDVEVLPVGDDGVGEVVLRRPATGNSLNPHVAGLLADAIGELGATARCVVLGSEGRVFCSGADLNYLDALVGMSEAEIASSIYANFQRMIRSIEECPVPVIARLQGGAAGAGCDLVLACDLVVASDVGWLEESWVKLGATSALAGAFHLTRTAGPQRALELLLSARRLDAQEARRYGVVNEVVPAERLEEATRSLAVAIASLDGPSVRAMKRLVRGAARPGFDQALALGLELQAALLARPELATRLDELRRRLRDRSNG